MMSIGIKDNQTSVSIAPVEESYIESAVDFSALWNRTYGGFSSDRFEDVVKCHDGGYAFVGTSISFSMVDRDIWIVRTNDNGGVIWSAIINETTGHDVAYSIIECENGDFVIVGWSEPTGDRAGRIDRLDADGNLLWTKMIGTPTHLDMFYDVIETDSGCLIAVGRTESWGVGLSDVLAVCLDVNGNEIWFRTYGGASDDFGYSIVECKNGGYAILAETWSFGEGNYDFWLIRVNVNGDVLWDETYGGINRDQPQELVEYSGGGFVMVGETRSFGDVQGDFWAVRVDETGTELWNETYVGSGWDFANAIVETEKGGFTIVGIAQYTSGVDQVRVTHIGLDGTEVWSNWYGGPNVDAGLGIVEVRPEEYMVCGYTSSYGIGTLDAWILLIPGSIEMIDAVLPDFVEYGEIPFVNITVLTTTPVDSVWITGGHEGEFRITSYAKGSGYFELDIDTLLPPDVDYYDLIVHVNNTRGYEEIYWIPIFVIDTTEPYWTDFDEEHTLEYGSQFQYTPQAGDLSFIDEWFLTGSTYFTINSSTGEITNVGTPSVGEYDLEIQVNDMYHNSLVDSLQILVQDTTLPEWNTAPEDQTIDYGVSFVYDLNASDLAGIASWSVSSTEFSIDSEGRIRNQVPLAPGEHAISVYVTDNNGNILAGSFSVLVNNPSNDTGTTQPGGSIIDSAIPFVVGVAATLAVVGVVYIFSRRKPSEK